MARADAELELTAEQKSEMRDEVEAEMRAGNVPWCPECDGVRLQLLGIQGCGPAFRCSCCGVEFGVRMMEYPA